MSRFEVVRQVAMKVVEFSVDPPLQVTGEPPTVNVTDPVGATGVKVTALKVAVNVTAVFRAAEVVGEIVTVGVSLVMVWVTVAAVAVL
jgi:hypothetical protein